MHAWRVALVLAVMTLGAAADPAAAATWVVNTTGDVAPSASDCQGVPGDCSLRQAIAKAGAEDTVELPASATPYAVTLAGISVEQPITISGAGARTTQIEGNGSSGIFAVSTAGTVTISGITISGGDQQGGTRSDGSGGAIDIVSGDVSLNAVALSGNSAGVAGGAVEVTSGAGLQIDASTIGPGNVADGNSDFAGTGGGIDNDGGELGISDSTISGNSALSGGTFGGTGGGLSTEAGGITTLEYDTVAFNDAAGSGSAGGNLYALGDDPQANITDTIVADGAAAGPGEGDCNGDADFLSGGYNLTDGVYSTGTASCGFTRSTDLLGDARLGGLTNNGGPTDTDALAAGSPAIDAIPMADVACTGADQRGIMRPQGLACDIGALESGGGETAPQWSVSHDFRTSPEMNPAPDSLGNSGVWSYEQAPLADQDQPAGYTLLASSGLSSCSNVYVWSDPSGFPDLGLNAGAGTDTCFTTVTYPPRTLFMSPATGSYGIVAWTSPVSGTVSVAGAFTSLDQNGGSGTTWFVDDGSTILAQGVNPVGGAGTFDLSSVEVTQGQTLYFLLGPAANEDASNDTTELSMTITQSSPTSADLSLAAQAQPNPVTVGQGVTDTFTVTNNGPDPSAGVSFSDPLPAEVTLQSASASQGSCSGATTVSCTVGSLGDGAQATITVVLVPIAATTVANTASVSATTADPNMANNSATATAQATAAPCQTSMVIDAVEVLADCITPQSGGTFLASGHTRFTDGASIVVSGTQSPAPLVIDPATHTIALAPASGGGAQTGELEAGGVDVATGQFTIDTQGMQDPVSGVAGAAEISGIGSADLSLSGWRFGDIGVAPTMYLAPSSTGGGAIVDGRLMLPAWLGPLVAFGTLNPDVVAVTGQLAVQADSSGRVSVINGGISFQSSLLGIPQLTVANAQLTYQRAGDVWSGTAMLGLPHLVGLTVNATIGQGKLDDLGVNFACSTKSTCGSGSVAGSTPGKPLIGTVLDIKDADLQMINLQGISYTPFSLPSGPATFCVPFRGRKCPPVLPPPPAPQVDGQIIVGALDDKVLAGGAFTYLLDGAFSASATVGLAPLFGHTFPYPAALQNNEQAASVVSGLLKAANAGVEIGSAQVNFSPPHLLQMTGTAFVPPNVSFLKGTFSIGVDPPHFTGEGTVSLIVPEGVPLIGGDVLGSAEGLVSDEAAAAQGSIPGYCIRYIGCTPSIGVLVALDWQNDHLTVDINGGNINSYATVPQASASSARAPRNRLTVRVPGGKQLATFTVVSARGTPNVRLIGPPARHRRMLTLASSRRARNPGGALAWTSTTKHSESFLVFLPSGGRWTASRLNGPQIVSVKVAVPSHKLSFKPFPRATPRSTDLPKGTVSTSRSITLHYSVPNAGPGTTVDLWAGTEPHGAGGVMIAEGLPSSGAATWNLGGLGSGRYWPYAIVNRNGIPVSIQYWPGAVDVASAAAPAAPTGVEAAPASGQVVVGWNAVPAAATYAVTASPAAGDAAVVHDSVPASQLGDQLTLAPGSWSITVQAVDAEDDFSVPSVASSVAVP